MMFTIPIIVAIFIMIFAFVLLLEPESLSKTSIQDKIMRNQFKSSKHKWETSVQKSFYFCYLCNKLTNGWFSDILECKKCGIIIHRICRYLKLRKPDCKYIVAKSSTSKFYHQWRQCSYSSSSNCTICNTICSGFQSYICLWCNRIRHGLCNGDSVQCDFGPLRKFILEPTQIKCTSINFTTDAFKSLRRIKRKLKEKTSGSDEDDHQQENDEDSKITINCLGNKNIVIVLINKKSGGQVGNDFINAFYRILNPLQVISILDEGMQKLKLFMDIPNIFFVIAGGDGTICSVLNYIKTLPRWKNINPPAAILPLGTGNDLSRSLGWGGSIEEVNPSELLMDYHQKGKDQLLDRWKMLAITGDETKEFTIYNYIGIGLDAKIVKDFHEVRQKYPELFFSQFSNKLIYTQIGTAGLFKTSCLLSELLTLKIDDKQISLEGIENIIFLNIMHWGGGVTQLWKENKDKHFQEQSFSDGLIEVIGLSDLIHMGQVQVGMDEPFQLGQGRSIQIIAKQSDKVIPLQIDGQPLQIMSPLKIVIERKDQVNVLATKLSENSKVLHVLQKGLEKNIIDQNQFEELLLLSKK